MRRGKLVTGAILFMSLCCMWSGCGGTPTRSSALSHKHAKPEDYFPMSAGSQWVYQITVNPQHQPLQSSTIMWPRGDSGQLSEIRGRFSGLFTRKPKKLYTLMYHIAKPPHTVKGKTFDGKVVQLVIDKDDLGVLKNYQAVYWMPEREDERFSVTQCVIHPATENSSDISPRRDGEEQRVIFFEGNEGEGVQTLSESDILSYLGKDGDQLRFARVVDDPTFQEESTESRDSSSYLEKPFAETM